MRRLVSKAAATLVALSAVMTIGIVVGVAEPASASSAGYCQLSVLPWRRNCTTGQVHASSSHRILVQVGSCGGGTWELKDIHSTVIVGRPNGRIRTGKVYINGLYGDYVANLRGGCAHDWIQIS
jgi:hypothetical protein